MVAVTRAMMWSVMNTITGRGGGGLDSSGLDEGRRGYNYAYFKMGEAVVKRTSVRNRNRLNGFGRSVEPSPPTTDIMCVQQLALLPAFCSCVHSAPGWLRS